MGWAITDSGFLAFPVVPVRTQNRLVVLSCVDCRTVGDLTGKNEFLLETQLDFRIRGLFDTNHLQRHLTIQLPVICQVNRTHTALSQKAGDLVAAADGCRGSQLNEGRRGDDDVANGKGPTLPARSERYGLQFPSKSTGNHQHSLHGITFSQIG